MRLDHGLPGPQPVDQSIIDRGYDPRDVSLTTILKWVFFLFVFIGVASAITLGVYDLYVPKGTERTTQFPLPRVREVPAEPRIQANPIEDIRTLRRNEEQELTRYGRDPATGDIYIPVDRAMGLVAQEGLPTRAQPGTIDIAEPNQPLHTEGQAQGAEPPPQTSAGPSGGMLQEQNPPGGAATTQTPQTGTATRGRTGGKSSGQ